MSRRRQRFIDRFSETSTLGKTLFSLSLVCLLIPAGCDREREVTSAVPIAMEKLTTADTSFTENAGKIESVIAETPEPTRFSLTYAADAHGEINGPARQMVYEGGDGSAVTAVPAPGYFFVSWSDGVDTATRAERNVRGDLVVTARFEGHKYTVTYAVGENGSLQGEPQQSIEHGGTGKSVKALPAPGYHFVKWSDGRTANPRTDAGMMEGIAVSAHFDINRYALNYTPEGNGSIEGAVSQTVIHGESGSTVTAAPGPRHHFVEWSDGVETPSRTDSNIIRNLSVTAEFAPDTYPVGGTVSGLVHGTQLTIQNNGNDDLPVAENGEFMFSQLVADGDLYAINVLTQPSSPNQSCTVTNGDGTLDGGAVADIRVNCVLNTYTVAGTISGLPEGGRLILQNNKRDDLDISTNGEFTFPQRLDDGSNYGVTIVRQRLEPNWGCSLDNASGKLDGSDVSTVEIACFPNPAIQAMSGFRKVDLRWNGQDFSDAVFNLCRAREEIPVDGFSRCAELKGGHLEMNVSTPSILSRLMFNSPYWFQLEVEHASGHRTYSQVEAATSFSGHNDTGIDWCADSNRNRYPEGMRYEKAESCKELDATHPGQDGRYGRDATARSRKLTKTGNGSGGFDFTKVCRSGRAAGEGDCPSNPVLGSSRNSWACTRDNVTGLMWEVKAGDGLHGQMNTYTWYNREPLNGGSGGTETGGQCEGSGCNTSAYVAAVNAEGLCGASDWRLPTRKELLSIVDNGRFNPAINPDYFPNTMAADYWSASPYADQANSAWQVLFRFGEVYAAEKSKGSHIRLVRQPH